MRFAGLLLMCAVTPGVLAAQADVTFDDLINALEASGKAIADVTVEYERRIEFADPAAAIKDARENNWIRLNIAKVELQMIRPLGKLCKIREHLILENGGGRTWEEEKVETYNGRLSKSYTIAHQPRSLGDGQWRSGRIARRPIDPVSINHTPLGLYGGTRQEQIDFKVVNLPEYFRQLRDAGGRNRRGLPEYFRQLLGVDEQNRLRLEFDNQIQRVNDYNVISVRKWLLRNNKESLFRTYFFSVDHDLALVAIRGMCGRDVCMTFDVKLQRLENGIWFPSEGAVRYLGSDGVSHLLKITNVSLNQGLTERDFNITFPAGTHVENHITGETYTVQPTEKQLDESLPKK